MNVFARFDENPAMTLEDIKETKRYGRTHGRTHGHMHGQRENRIPTTNKVCGWYNYGNVEVCIGLTTGASPVFTVCHKVISLVYSLFQYIIRDGILLSWKGPCGFDYDILKFLIFHSNN